jgi:hypothetical protein
MISPVCSTSVARIGVDAMVTASGSRARMACGQMIQAQWCRRSFPEEETVPVPAARGNLAAAHAGATASRPGPRSRAEFKVAPNPRRDSQTSAFMAGLEDFCRGPKSLCLGFAAGRCVGLSLRRLVQSSHATFTVRASSVYRLHRNLVSLLLTIHAASRFPIDRNR